MDKNLIEFDNPFTDGTYTAPCKKEYHWKDMFNEVKKIGRPLTEKEAQKFEILDEDEKKEIEQIFAEMDRGEKICWK